MINIWDLIIHLKTYTDITDVLWNRIFYGWPKSEQSDIYMTINVVTWNQVSQVEVSQRLEFRLIWTTDTLTSDLQDLSQVILNATREFQWGYRFVQSNFANWLDEKKRRVFIQDIIINNVI